MKKYNSKIKTHTKSYTTPITSYGIIHFMNNKYLMICRRNSLGYTDFIRGKYSLKNIKHICNLIDEMTNNEKKDLLEKNFNSLWNNLWGIQYSDNSIEELNAEDKFNTIKNGVIINNTCITLKELIYKSITSWECPEWGFPKGRRNSYESELNCALREYEEETGYDKYNIKILKNVLPYEEIFTGSNYKSYIHKYFVGKSNQIIIKHSFQESEVSDMKWVTYEEAIQMIRPYNVERIQILEFIHKCWNMFELSEKS
jgi:ADP-ribose pyrophosphatase YjhB (NUDIX family)